MSEIKKTGKEIASEVLYVKINSETLHTWLSSATINELQEYLRWIPVDNPGSQRGRDTLNILLANENIKLQTDIKDMTDKMKKMTKWVVGLTIIIAFLTFIQAYQGFKIIYADIYTLANPPEVNITTPQTKGTDNQTNTTNQTQNGKNNNLKKTEVIKHKKNP